MKFVKTVTWVLCFSFLIGSSKGFSDQLSPELIEEIRAGAPAFCKKPGPQLVLKWIFGDRGSQESAEKEILSNGKMFSTAMSSFLFTYNHVRVRYQADNELSDSEVFYTAFSMLKKRETFKFIEADQWSVYFIEEYPESLKKIPESMRD